MRRVLSSDARSVPLMVRGPPGCARRPRSRPRFDRVIARVSCPALIQVPHENLIRLRAGSLDEASDLARGAGELASGPGGRPHLLISRGENFLAQRFEQAGQIKIWVPACHRVLQFR